MRHYTPHYRRHAGRTYRKMIRRGWTRLQAREYVQICLAMSHGLRKESKKEFFNRIRREQPQLF